MRHRLLLPLLLLLTACSGPLPKKDPTMAWVDLDTLLASQLLMAEALDGKRLDDGRYFQVTPGAHTLRVRMSFELGLTGGGGSDFSSEPVQITCYLNVHYDDFKAGEHYRLQGRNYLYQATAYLYDAQRRQVAEGEQDNCLPY